jgi:hypothetical protein
MVAGNHLVVTKLRVSIGLSFRLGLGFTLGLCLVLAVEDLDDMPALALGGFSPGESSTDTGYNMSR